MNKFKEYLIFDDVNIFDQPLKRYKFKNGYGASIAKTHEPTGKNSRHEELYELIVMLDDEYCYETEITEDIIEFLTNREVCKYLEMIKELEQ